VTGTNGKTTTTALVAHLLNCGGIPARAIGNIGAPAIEAVAEAGAEVFVAEVSSFQLALTEKFHPRVAVLLNVTPDHIDWHGSLERYALDKTRVFTNLGPDDTAVVDVDDAGSAPYADQVAESGAAVVRVSREHVLEGGANAASGILTLETRGGTIELVSASELKIVGPHNVSNALAAAAAAHAVGVTPNDLKRGLLTFEPIEHRLEPAGRARGAEWYNDSKATNPDAVMKALAAFGERPLVLLAGGRNKGNTFDELAAAALPVVRLAITFGEAGPDIADAFERAGITVERVAHMEDAVAAAAQGAHEGDAVVLSPACASFDEFTGYEHRGRVFKQLVREIERGGGTT
jgi:UDP-N-acetylmuramoylalanine--D-glutamate ligase